MFELGKIAMLDLTLPVIVFLFGAIVLVVAVIRRFQLPQAQVNLSKGQSVVLGLIGTLLIALAIASYVVPVKSNNPDKAENSCAPIISNEPLQRIVVYEGSYHLGDDSRPDLTPSEPQTNPFQAKFQVDEISENIYLQLTVRDVSPIETKEPVRIFLNGEFIDFLNRYVDEQKTVPTVIEVRLPQSVLRRGANNILIFTTPYISSNEKGVDDFEISHVGIIFK